MCHKPLPPPPPPPTTATSYLEGPTPLGWYGVLKKAFTVFFFFLFFFFCEWKTAWVFLRCVNRPKKAFSFSHFFIYLFILWRWDVSYCFDLKIFSTIKLWLHSYSPSLLDMRIHPLGIWQSALLATALIN